MNKVLAALGDSVTCGEGVGLRVPAGQTWPSLLGAATGLTPQSLAVAGATVADVREKQLPKLPRCDVAGVLIGLNDVCRGSFDESRFEAEIATVLHGLQWRADRILLATLPDPSRYLWVPKRVRRLVSHRLAAANAAITRAAASSSHVQVLDLAAVPDLALRCAWSPDRVHPSPFGHVAIAAAATELLGALPTSDLTVAPPAERAPNASQAWWLMRHGTGYLVRRGHTFARPVLEGLRRAG
ncbi:MAG TPA: GDSL-type esterase/lipase family protein [Mycobacteriales bacterium]|jgi:lysophospholipase L1-like esterase|nr:GDSL-type esterase/lipase family protein [Mycobacteriales bacterium]